MSDEPIYCTKCEDYVLPYRVYCDECYEELGREARSTAYDELEALYQRLRETIRELGFGDVLDQFDRRQQHG